MHSFILFKIHFKAVRLKNTCILAQEQAFITTFLDDLIANCIAAMCQFVPTNTLLSAIAQGDFNEKKKLLDRIKLQDVSEFSSVTNIENGTQTVLTGKAKGKPTHEQKTESKTGIKTITSTNKHYKRRKLKLMDWRRFHRLRDIYDFIDELERDYPAICTVSVIGKSVEGRDIKMLKISNSDARNSPVWLDASIHPREWISTAVVTYVADQLVKNFKKLSNCLTNKDWFIVPVLNPDGYEYTHTCNRMWRKNRATYDGTCVGVDLNRNFSYAWGFNGEEGSSEDPHNIFFRGPAPFSEPETAAVRDVIMSSSTPFKAFLSFHSYFELIIFPWGFQNEPCPHYLHLLEGAMAMSRAIYNTTGMIYKVGSTKDMTYFACGTSIDWSYGVAKIPYSYMIELRSKKYKFRLPRDQIQDTCKEVWNAVTSLMSFIDEKEQ